MRICVIARSISRPVQERLQKGTFAAHVLAVFDHACDLVTSDGDVVALVTPQVGDGPLNVVVEVGPGDFAAVEPGMATRGGGRHLRIGGLEVALGRAAVWDPRPDWSALHVQRAVIESRLPFLWTISPRHAPPGSLLTFAAGWGADFPPVERGGLRGGALLRAGWEGDLAQLQDGATRLAGLGGGLTPAGDDFLTGVMLWSWLAHPSPRSFCQALLEVAAPRTTTLSAAFLRAAAEGQCSASWHALLAALSEETEIEITAAVREVLAHGATSGADALAGFLWMGSHERTHP